jgi:hypothetical protein
VKLRLTRALRVARLFDALRTLDTPDMEREHGPKQTQNQKMKTALAIALAISLTCNVFLFYLHHEAQAPASRPDDPRIVQLQQDEAKLAHIKLALPILVVIFEDKILAAKFSRNQMQFDKTLAEIDTSKCPMDFQQAWLAYIQERQNNLAIRRHVAGQLIIDGLGAVAFPEFEAVAGKQALSTIANAPTQSNAAYDNLQQVFLKYGFQFR